MLTPITLILASYQIYNDKQEELNRIYEEHHPILTIDSNIKDGSIFVDLGQRIVQFTIDYTLNNIGDRPAYQTIISGFVSPLYRTDTIMSYQNSYRMNPIYTTVKGNIDAVVKYSQWDTKGIVILYMHLKYSNLPQNGTWNEEEYWFAFTLDLSTNKCSWEYVKPEWIDYFRPYTDKVFPSEIPIK